jgi:aspartyl-tRNA(Asn)/glutamyl-tRNA(Gln) amidotransferase subunit C
LSDQNISKEQILHIAHLARLEVDSDNVAALEKDLNNILGYVHSLQALDLSEVEPTAHGSLVPTPLREDEIQPSLGAEKALAAAPQSGNSAFIVPKVVG